MEDTLVMIMAGGKGSRLAPLTSHRAKPAVPFGGRYRIIDFVLSNFVNSGYRRIFVLTQFMASSLIRHLNRNWHLAGFGSFIEIVPAQMRTGDEWYKGTADAVFQNLNLIDDQRPEHVAVFGGDHVYVFDVAQMEEQHRDTGADLTIAAIPVPLEEASRFGVIQCDDAGRIIGFQEKPARPTPMPGRPDHALVSMGNYIFRRAALKEWLVADAARVDSRHDFGRDVIPGMVEAGLDVYVYDFATNRIPDAAQSRAPYWRDVGTLDSYFDANMDVRDPVPPIDMYNRRWPIRTAQRNYPPARFVTPNGCEHGRIVDSLVCEGSILAGAVLERAVIGYDCFLHNGSHVEDAVVLSGCNIGADCRVRGILLDKNCSIEPGTVIGFDPEQDRRRFPFITAQGRVVLPKGTHVPRNGPIHFADDMIFLLENDPAAQRYLRETEVEYLSANQTRHSHEAVGPRFEKFGRHATTGLYSSLSTDEFRAHVDSE